MYVAISLLGLDDLFECIPTILITIIFSFKLEYLMANDEKVNDVIIYDFINSINIT